MKNRAFIILLNALIIGSFSLFFISCDNDDMDGKIPEGQQVYFQYYYINHAWGNQLDGFIIDETGAVRTFDEDPLKWNFPSEEGYLSIQEMSENFYKTKVAWPKVSKEDLNTYINKIDAIIDGNVTKEEGNGADGGLYIYGCYQFDSKKNQYKFILLDQSGDTERSNKDSNAISILSWMKTIFNKLQ